MKTGEERKGQKRESQAGFSTATKSEEEATSYWAKGGGGGEGGGE